MDENDAACSSATQTTLVKSFLNHYNSDGAYGSTMVYVFSNSAAASSFTSEYPFLEQLSAAATTTPAQTSSTTDEVEISTGQDYTITAQAQPISLTSSSTTQLTSISPAFIPATTSATTPSFTDVVPALPIPSSGLSSSEKTGIGIGASLGALSLALLIFSIYRYLKHKKRSRQMHAANIPPILASPPGSPVNEAEKRLATGSQQLGAIGYGANGPTGTQMKESTNGLGSPHELGEESSLNARRELSRTSAVEYARDSGVRSAVGRSELA